MRDFYFYATTTSIISMKGANNLKKIRIMLLRWMENGLK